MHRKCLLSAVASLVTVCSWLALQGNAVFASGQADLDAQIASDRTGGKMDKKLRHVVCFKFRDGVAAGDQEKVEKEFCALKGRIPIVVDLEWGTNNSPEHLNKGLTHCFILTFASEKDRDAYLVHPAHLEFVKLIKQFTDDAMVIDFWKTNASPEEVIDSH